MKKFNLDVKSIKFKLWLTFIFFSVMLIALIWLLQIFFMDTYYEDMKMKEAKKTASEIVEDFRTNQDLKDLRDDINDITLNTDMYIRVETGKGDRLVCPSYDGYRQLYLYDMQIENMRERLLNSRFQDISTISPGENDTRTLAYACYLYQAPGATEEESNNNSCILYLFSPLYPVKSTVSILKVQLIYITIIAVILAMALALYLANRISRPIQDITKSAVEMGHGNYDVKFRKSHFSEITDLSNTLTVASQELKKTEQYQKDLIANVSHDLRTPLTMIKSYAEMIRDLSGDNPKKRNDHLEVIIQEADRLSFLVNDMLNMSRMQSGNMVLNKDVFDISKTVRSLMASYEILNEQEGYNITLDCTDGIKIYGDETKIKQVISNLLSNAVKYCGDDKMIMVKLSRTNKKMRFEVSDHGRGIASDEIPHVWDRYYKSSTHHVRPTDGSGLGLSIVKQIFILHDADYGVDSTPGEGSCFWFEMPALKNKPIRPEIKKQHRPIKKNRKNIKN